MGHYFSEMFPDGKKEPPVVDNYYYNISELPILKYFINEARKDREKWQIDVMDKQARHMWE